MKNTIIGLVTALTLAVSASTAIAGSGNATGTFSGLNNHVVTGHYTVEKQSDGSHILTLADDFVLDGAPDPSVGFGKNGKYTKGAYLKNLSNNKGKQTFNIPASVDLTSYNEVYIWCNKFSVSLGKADLHVK